MVTQWDLFPSDFPLFHLWYFVKQFLKYMWKKTILNKLLISEEQCLCCGSKVAISTRGNQEVRILRSEVFYRLPILYWSKKLKINKYKVCSNKSRTAYFDMWSSSLPDLAVRCGKPCSVPIFSSVSSCSSPISIFSMLAIFVWNLMLKSYVRMYQIKQAILQNITKDDLPFVDSTVNNNTIE